MTKDRRLGRGLAALLGSPLEEEMVVDGTVTSGAATAAMSPSAQRTATGSANSNRTPSSGSSNAPGSGGSRPVTPRAAASSPRQESTSSSTSGNTGSAAKTDEISAGNTRSAARSAPASSTRTTVTGSVPLNRSDDEASSETLTVLEINVSEIDNNPFQPRRKFNEEEIASLAESIREHEQLQPILVRRHGRRYQLISGERRLRATIHAGFKKIRAEVREADDRLVAELAIVENLQRKDLDAIEKAMSFRRYINEHQCKQDDLAKRLKIDRSTIANLMRLLELPPAIQEAIQAETLTAGHARALLPLGDEKQQMEFARLIQAEGWNVRETERRVTEALAMEDGAIAGKINPPAANRKRITPQIAQLEQQMRLAFGTKTEIRQTASGRGKISIAFANNDEFERICALIMPAANVKSA